MDWGYLAVISALPITGLLMAVFVVLLQRRDDRIARQQHDGQ